MTNLNRTLLCLTVLCAFSLNPSASQPMILLSDDFNDRTLGQNVGCPSGTETCFSDWGDNNNALGGTITQTYIHTPDRTSPGGVNQTIEDADNPTNGENEGISRFGAVQIDYNLGTDSNVLGGGGYTIELNLRRGGGNFVAVHFGADQTFVGTTLNGAAFVVEEPDTDASFLFQDDGGGGKRVKFQPFGDKDTEEGNAKVMDIGGLSDEVFDVKIDVTAPNGFDNGDTVTYDVTVDGGLIYTESIVADGTFSGYVGFSTNSGGVTGGIYDDIKITAFEDLTPGLPGDFNDDLIVNIADYTVWRDNLGSSFDLNGNGDETGGSAGVVDVADYSLWKSSFGNTSAAATLQAPGMAAVPEPAAAVVLLAAIGGVALSRRLW